jgi:hypothetical protein
MCHGKRLSHGWLLRFAARASGLAATMNSLLKVSTGEVGLLLGQREIARICRVKIPRFSV